MKIDIEILDQCEAEMIIEKSLSISRKNIAEVKNKVINFFIELDEKYSI